MQQGLTQAFLDKLGEDEVRHRFDRGDYHDQAEVAPVKAWLKKAEKQRAFLAACERASISSSLVAERSAKRANVIALIALAFAIVGAHDNIASFIDRVFLLAAP